MHKKNIMKKDFMTHGEGSKIQCEICEVCFTTKRSLKLHIASVHGKQKPYNCELCNTKFTQQGSLKAHIESVHEGKKPFQCDYCGFRTSAKQKLTVHIEGTHEGKKHYCSYCDKNYTQRGTLVSHMRSHITGKVLIECNKCDFKAENNHILKRHEKTHENSDIDLNNREMYSYSFDVSDIKKIKELKEINEEDSDFESEVNNREMPKRKCVRDITTEKC